MAVAGIEDVSVCIASTGKIVIATATGQGVLVEVSPQTVISRRPGCHVEQYVLPAYAHAIGELEPFDAIKPLRTQRSGLETRKLVSHRQGFAGIERHNQIGCFVLPREDHVFRIDARCEGYGIGAHLKRKPAKPDIHVDIERLLINDVVASAATEEIRVIAIEPDESVIPGTGSKGVIIAEPARDVITARGFGGDQLLLDILVGVDIAIVTEREKFDARIQCKLTVIAE